jgi:CBS domain-containing protein
MREEPDMTIAAVLARKGGQVISVPKGSSVRAAVAALAGNRIGALPILDPQGRVAGILSERDIVACFASRGERVLELSVDLLMTSPPITVERDAAVISALSLMSARRIRHLPVVEGERLVGFVSIGDLVAHRVRHIENEAEAMRANIQGS